MKRDVLAVADSRPTWQPASSSDGPQADASQILDWLGGSGQAVCTLRAQSALVPIRRSVAARAGALLSFLLLAWLAWLAMDLSSDGKAPSASLILGLLAVSVPLVILSRYSDGVADELACPAAAKTLLVSADGKSVWFRADDLHATLAWAELAGITEDSVLVHFHRSDGTQVRVANVAGYEHVIRAARRIVAARREADGALLGQMQRGLSPAEDSADAGRGLSVSR